MSVESEQRPTKPGDAAPVWLHRARWVWIAAVLVGFIRSFVQLADREALVTQLREEAPELRQDQVDAAASSGILFAVLLSALSLMVYLLLSRRMLEGRNWARIVLTVFGGFNAFSTAVTLLTVITVDRALLVELTGIEVPTSNLVFSAVVMVLQVVAIAFMFHPGSNRYFREVRRAR